MLLSLGRLDDDCQMTPGIVDIPALSLRMLPSPSFDTLPSVPYTDLMTLFGNESGS